MKRKIIVLTDKQAKELETYPNQSEVMRNAFEVYHGHITPEVIKGLHLTYEKIHKRLIGIEGAVDAIAENSHTSVERNNDWGA